MQKISIQGRCRVKVVNPDGTVVSDSGWMKNKITTAGLAQIASLAGDATAVPFTYLAVGTSSTAVSAAHTGLQAEISDSGLERAAATVTRSTTTSTNDTLQLDYTWTASGSKSIEEIGVFNASSSGTMLGRLLTTTKAIISGQSFIATYKVTFTGN